MVLLRLLGILAAIAIVLNVAAYLLTRNPKYASWAWKIAQISVFVALGFFGLIILERFVLIPL